MNKNTTIVIVIILLAVLGIIFYQNSAHKDLNVNVSENSSGENTEGTSVTDTTGGTTIPTPTTPQAVTGVKIGEKYTSGSFTGTVTEVLEDSRCPKDVQCIQAGTVRVKVHATYGVLSQDVVLTLGVPYTVSGHSFTLTNVTPDKVSTQTIAPGDYRFTFSII